MGLGVGAGVAAGVGAGVGFGVDSGGEEDGEPDFPDELVDVLVEDVCPDDPGCPGEPDDPGTPGEPGVEELDIEVACFDPAPEELCEDIEMRQPPLLHFACLMSDSGHGLDIVARQSASVLQLPLPEISHCAMQPC